MRNLRVTEFCRSTASCRRQAIPKRTPRAGSGMAVGSGRTSTMFSAGAAAEGRASTGAYLFGRKTYEKMAAFRPNAPADDLFAQHLNSTPKYVASRTLERAE
jgi:hypothetical protein